MQTNTRRRILRIVWLLLKTNAAEVKEAES